VGGGVDKTNFVLSISQVLASIDKEFNAVLLTNVQKPKSLDARFSVISIGSGLDFIANDMDLIFSTASTTSLEFLARGIAVAIGCAVDNQQQYYSDLASRRVVQPIGEFTDKWMFKIKSIFEIVEDENLRHNLRTQTFNLIDLLGSKRVVDLIIDLI
jgi:spore coat polysaccharide biosynthesis predicted glycosyltransferase SpsG